MRVENFKRLTIFLKHLVQMNVQKLQVTLNNPIYLGQCIFDESKVLMANFHYNTTIENA